MIKVVCPNCGYEYLPVEIFIPNSVFGKYIALERDDDGKIIDDESIVTDMNLVDSYRCDGCGRKFEVKMNIDFETSSESADFSEEYSTKINKPNLFMKED